MTLSRRSLAIAAVVACVIVVTQPLACRAIAGVEERTLTCGGGLAAGECGVCQSERCCDYARACDGRVDCTRFRECTAACAASDELCPGRCANTYPEGASAVGALDDCGRRLCSETCGSWSCLGEVVWPFSPSSVTFTLRLTDALDQHPIHGVKLQACSFAKCGDEQVVTDENGAARITLSGPRDGFVRVSGNEVKHAVDGGPTPDAGTTEVGYQGLIFFSPPLSQDNVVVETSILTIEAGRTIGGNVLEGIDIDTKGAVLVMARDCDGLLAKGVVVDIMPRDPSVRQVYIDGVLPNPTLEETTPSGLAVLVNVPPRAITLTAYSNVARRQTGARQVLVRAGHVTYIEMPPMPERFE